MHAVLFVILPRLFVVWWLSLATVWQVLLAISSATLTCIVFPSQSSEKTISNPLSRFLAIYARPPGRGSVLAFPENFRSVSMILYPPFVGTKHLIRSATSKWRLSTALPSGVRPEESLMSLLTPSSATTSEHRACLSLQRSAKQLGPPNFFFFFFFFEVERILRRRLRSLKIDVHSRVG